MFLVFACGAWTLQPWAWALGVGLTAGSIVLEVLGSLTQGEPIAGTLISIAISAAILFFLFRPDVRAALARS
jgi:quinol-cytochrome oxidoreductase complex cytochrome b subunit